MKHVGFLRSFLNSGSGLPPSHLHVCMCVCMYVCMYDVGFVRSFHNSGSDFASSYTYICIMHTYVHAHVCIGIRMSLHVGIHACMCTCVCMYAYVMHACREIWHIRTEILCMIRSKKRYKLNAKQLVTAPVHKPKIPGRRGFNSRESVPPISLESGLQAFKCSLKPTP